MNNDKHDSEKNDPRWWFKHMNELDKARTILKRRLIENILNQCGVVGDIDSDAIAEKILFELSQCESATGNP